RPSAVASRPCLGTGSAGCPSGKRPGGKESPWVNSTPSGARWPAARGRTGHQDRPGTDPGHRERVVAVADHESSSVRSATSKAKMIRACPQGVQRNRPCGPHGCTGRAGSRSADAAPGSGGIPASRGATSNSLTEPKPSTRSYQSALILMSLTVSANSGRGGCVAALAAGRSASGTSGHHRGRPGPGRPGTCPAGGGARLPWLGDARRPDHRAAANLRAGRMPGTGPDTARPGEAPRHIAVLPHSLSGVLGDLGQRAGGLWHHAFTAQPLPPRWLVLGSGALALAVVASSRVWPVARTVVTIVHEGGHALVALATGRRLAGVRLYRNTAGETFSAGRPDGPGIALTTAAGSPAPSLLGLGAAALLAIGHLTGMLLLSLVLLAGLTVAVRNAYGILAVL